jgi:hypothetical protein
VNGDDHGTGVFTAGPPRFVGGQNASSGVLGGFQELLTYLDGTAVPPWSSYAEDYWNSTDNGMGGTEGIWQDVERAALSTATNAFPDSVSPMLWDNGAGVAWDTDYTTGLAPGADQKFAIVNRTAIPSSLVVNPTAQSLTVGQTANVQVTAHNSNGDPYANLPLRYTITGANPHSGAVNTNASGVATITYQGANAGVDLLSFYLDLANSMTQTPADPAGTAQVTFVPPPPNSGVTVKTVTVNANGTITITYVPTDPGQGTLTVTVPTASVARHPVSATEAKRKTKKCKKGTVLIKKRCQSPTSAVGVARGQGTPGVPLTLSVKPSGKAAKALAKGKTLHVTASLIYQSARGGLPSIHVYHLTLKGRKHHKRK